MELAQKLQENQSEVDNQTLQYFNKKVKPLYSKLIINIINSKPEDILQYCTKWFRDRKGQKPQKFNDDQNSEDDTDLSMHFENVDDKQFYKWRAYRLEKGRQKRYGLSSQKAFRGSIKVQKGERKQENTFMRILFFCMNSFLFKNFSEKEIAELIEKMKKIQVQSDQQICREGEYGDRMYFVDEGIFQCIQSTQKGPRSIKNYYVGDTFGQICLLHMVKRQASIYSRSQGVLYSLDRQSYIHFKKMCMIKKRTLYMCTLVKQRMFSSFSEEKLQKICDVLTQVQYQQGQIVINEGDVGSKYYIIIDGISIAYKGSQENVKQCYKQGDGFGEVALIKDMPRQASVKTLTRSRMVYITRQVFRRIFDNIHLLEKDIDDKYGHNGNFILRRRPQHSSINNQDQKQQKSQSLNPSSNQNMNSTSHQPPNINPNMSINHNSNPNLNTNSNIPNYAKRQSIRLDRKNFNSMMLNQINQ